MEGESPDPEIVDDATASEIQAALHLTRRAAGVQTDLAYPGSVSVSPKCGRHFMTVGSTCLGPGSFLI